MVENVIAKLVAPRKFELVTEPIERVDDDKILVRNEVCGVCQGTEIWPWKGTDCNSGEPANYPQVMGHQNAGEVVEVGKNVTDVRVGDTYTGLGVGGYQAYSLADPATCCRVPDGMPAEEATQALELASIIKEVDAAGIHTSDTVAILGGGPMGNLLLQVVRLYSPRMIVVTDLEDSRLQYARQMGADHTINADREDQVQRVLELTDGGASVVFEATCSIACLKLAVQMLRAESKLVVFGTHPEPMDIRPDVLKRKSCTAYFTFPLGPAEWTFYAQAGVKLLASGGVKIAPLVTHRFALENMDEAFALIETRPADIMKVMITP